MAFASARDPIRFHLGRVLASLFPARLRHQESQFTRPENDAPAPGLTDRLIRYYLAHRTLGNPLALERMHRRFWEHQTPEDWYQLGATRHKTRHVPIFGPIISALGAPLMARDRPMCDRTCPSRAGSLGLATPRISTAGATSEAPGGRPHPKSALPDVEGRLGV